MATPPPPSSSFLTAPNMRGLPRRVGCGTPKSGRESGGSAPRRPPPRVSLEGTQYPDGRDCQLGVRPGKSHPMYPFTSKAVYTKRHAAERPFIAMECLLFHARCRLHLPFLYPVTGHRLLFQAFEVPSNLIFTLFGRPRGEEVAQCALSRSPPSSFCRLCFHGTRRPLSVAPAATICVLFRRYQASWQFRSRSSVTCLHRFPVPLPLWIACRRRCCTSRWLA